MSFYGDGAKNYRPIKIENHFRHSYKTYCLLVQENCRDKLKVNGGNCGQWPCLSGP